MCLFASTTFLAATSFISGTAKISGLNCITLPATCSGERSVPPSMAVNPPISSIVRRSVLSKLRILQQRTNHNTSLDLFLINLDPWSNSRQRLLRRIFTFLHLRNRIALYFVKIRDDIHRISNRINNIVRTTPLRNNLHRNPRSILMITFQNQICQLFRSIVRYLRLFFSSHRSPSSSSFPAFLP